MRPVRQKISCALADTHASGRGGELHAERSVEENLTLLEAMKRGDFEDGAKTLRAKIDMASPTFICGSSALSYSQGEPPSHGRCLGDLPNV